MAEILSEVLHRIRVKLYPNYLPKVEGEFIARTENEATLSIEDVCTALDTRGGFTGNYEDLVEHVRQYLKEAAYQLCDGYAVSTGYYSIHPNVGGTFENRREGVSKEKHPVTFRFRTRSPLRDLAERIEIFVEGIADTGAFIDEFTDLNTGLINEKATAGGQFILTGGKIKIAGDSGTTGLYFVPTDDSVSFKVTAVLAENDRSQLIGIIPSLLPAKVYRLEVRTQFTNGSTLLKELRTIKSDFTVTRG
jgi:hypothetical protein